MKRILIHRSEREKIRNYLVRKNCVRKKRETDKNISLEQQLKK